MSHAEAEPTRQPRDPRAREELGRFRATFGLALDQIGLLSRYKELHDTLQRLEVPFNAFARERKRLLDNPAAWDDIYAPIADLQVSTGVALEIMADPRMADQWRRPIDNLQRASADLALAQEQADVRRLDMAVVRYESVLTRDLPSVDSRLVTCSGSLHLAEVTEALAAVQAALPADARNMAARNELAGLIATLRSLRARLDTLVPEHHGWQDVDSELRRVDTELNIGLGGSPVALELAWDDLQRQTLLLFGAATEAWAAELNALGAQIGQALAAGAIPLVRRHFVGYRRRANQRFVKVDDALLKACGELREAGLALTLILRVLNDDELEVGQAPPDRTGDTPPAAGEAAGLRGQLLKHRITLGAYLGQIAIAGSANARPEVTYGIDEARQRIRRIKERLRALGQAVEDEMNDDE